MSMMFFNTDHGLPEAVVRGFRSTFLSRDDFVALRENTTLAGFNSVLMETDFSDIMPRKILSDAIRTDGGGGVMGEAASGAGAAAAGGPGGGGRSGGDVSEFDHTKLRRLFLEKASEEFQMLRAHAVEPLSTFLDFCTHEYMIDMIVSVMQAVRDVDESSKTAAIVEEVRAAAAGSHPLGRLDPATETALAGFGASATDIVELVRTLLVETPVGTYFEDFLLQLLSPEDLARDDGLAETLREQPLYLFEHATKRLWMERFHAWCADQGGETAELMCGILEERASLLAIQLTDNTLADGVVRPEQRPEVLRACFPAIGPLHPTGLDRLTAAASQDDIEAVVRDYEGLHALWTACPSVPSSAATAAGSSEAADGTLPGDLIKSLTGTFRRHLAHRYSLLFTSQFHFGSFYAFVKLKDLEADAVEKTANAVARAERSAAAVASASSGARARGPAAGEVMAFVKGLVIPFYQASPTDPAGDGAGAASASAQL